MATDTARLLRGVKRRITQPANQNLLGDSDILELADDVMKDRMVPLVMSTRQNYFVTATNQAVTDGTNTYDIPYRAMARGLRDIKYSFDGTQTGIKSLPQIALEDEHLFSTTGDPVGFYFKGDKVVVLPTPTNSSQFIEMWWEWPPSQLVQTTAAALVSSLSVGATTTTITIAGAVPTTMVSSTVCDIVQGRSGNSVLSMDIVLQNASASQLTFNKADVPATMIAGDWVTLAAQSPVIQLPNEAYPLFETEICARVLYAIGDFEGQNALLAKGQDQEKQLKMLLEPRILGEPTKIVNRHGLLRTRNMPFWRGRGFYT